MSDDTMTGRTLAWLISVLLAFFGGLYPSVKLAHENNVLREQLNLQSEIHESSNMIRESLGEVAK